jgi:hypothetical protein
MQQRNTVAALLIAGTPVCLIIGILTFVVFVSLGRPALNPPAEAAATLPPPQIAYITATPAVPPSPLPPATATATPPVTREAPEYSYISGIGPNTRRLFQLGQAMGNRMDIFSKVGDSITASPAFLTAFGTGQYDLREYTQLQPLIDYYLTTPAREKNSFENTSLAAQVGWSSLKAISPGNGEPGLCAPDESPLECEYRVVRPGVALIMLGTNDVPTVPASDYEAQMRRVLQITQEYGVLPILSTIPPMPQGQRDYTVLEFNQIITRLAGEYNIPLVDYHAVLETLPNRGMSEDGIHPSQISGSFTFSADFTPSNLTYGMTARNLTALQVLDAVWRVSWP